MHTTRVVTIMAAGAALCVACQAPEPQLELEAESVRVHAIVASDTVKPSGVPADFVATPVGFFHPSCLVHVDAHPLPSVRAAASCAYPHYSAAGHLMAPPDGAATTPTDPGTGAGAGPTQRTNLVPPLRIVPQQITNDVEGWSLADHSSFMAGVTRLTAQWTVPPTPPQSGQVLFFFPGTQSLDGKSGGTILQPVLAYENSQWFVQSWNCCEGGGNAEFGDAVNVRPGDTIVGTNIGSNCNAGNGICNNWQIITADTSTGGQSVFNTFSFNHPHQWIFANVLEVYNLKSCDQLPTTGSLTYHNFAIWDMQGRGINVPAMQWHDDVDQQLANCGGSWGGSQSGTDFTVTWGGPRGGGGGGGSIGIPFSGKCLDVYAAGSANGQKIEEYSCNGSGAQSFRLAAAANIGGAYNIINTNSNKCVDIAASGTADGTKAQLWDCNSTGAQSFYRQDVGGGNVRFVNTNSNKCLDVNGAHPDDNTQVQLWSCNGTVAQTWHVN
jgi:hypothetical protein